MYDRFTCHHVTCDCRTCQRDRRHLCDVPDRAGGAGLRARLRVAHRQGITHVPITALAIFWLTFALFGDLVVCVCLWFHVLMAQEIL